MKFSYEDLISGDAIYVDGVGHLRSPQLKELKPTQGIGTWNYNLFLSMLSWDKQEFINFFQTLTKKKLKKLEKNPKITVFDAMILIDESRKLLHNAMAFFICEDLIWDAKNYRFAACVDNDPKKIIGYISRDNFDDVKDMILQLNYIGVDEKAAPTSHSSDKAKELWEKAQQYLKECRAKAKPKEGYSLGNIISKMCAAPTGYNLSNIYELTVFQLYDQFFQYGYLRAMNLNEMAFSNHGGKNFDMQAWIKPILKK